MNRSETAIVTNSNAPEEGRTAALDVLDLVVIGAGPAGIALVAEARAAGVPAERIAVIEKSDSHSFTIRKYYPQGKPVLANYKGIVARCEGVLCIRDLSREETLSYLDVAIRDSGVAVRYREEVYRISQRPDGLLVVHTSRAELFTRVVVIAIGILGRPNRLPAAVPRSLQNAVLYDVTSEALRGVGVLVVGGGDSAAEYVQYLCQEGNRVTLSYRGADLSRPNPINRDSVLALERAGQVRILYSSNVTALSERNGRAQVTFDRPDLPPLVVDRLVVALGGTTPANFLKAAGIEFDGPAPRLGEGFATSVSGLYLAGDLTAGRTGGSIILAFNSASRAMRKICDAHGICALPLRAAAQAAEATG